AIVVITGSASGMGMLYGNGYTAAATGIGTVSVSADGSEVTLFIQNMPAKSAIAFGVGAVADGSGKAFVINETLHSDRLVCEPGSLSGKVFHDVNGDGVFNNADMGINIYKVTVTDEKGFTKDLLTDDKGDYQVTGLQPGTYTVSIKLVDPYTGTSTVTTYSVLVLDGKNISDLNFGLIKPPSPINTPITPTATATSTAVPNPTATPSPTATQKAIVSIPYTGDSNNLAAYLGIALVCALVGGLLLAASAKRKNHK
ncbi:MAG: SdrD B-like domain-containing protein, partial [Anaerolineaceae bacterium]|nr:SdrD B-like domain-containing protein [Anaerolineaceae bacterium]